jgi:hypothetical protein
VSAGPAPGADHAAALDWAATFREYRDHLYASLSDGTRSLSEVLDAPPDDELLAETKLLGVLESLPGARKTDTRRTLDRLGVPGDVRLGSLTVEQRRSLLESFPLAAVRPVTEKEPSR